MNEWRDERSGRVAIVPDGTADALVDRLAADGWGVVLLPPPGNDALLEIVADEVREFLRAGMTVELAGDAPALEERVGPLPRLG
jgi:hypothetical protein